VKNKNGKKNWSIWPIIKARLQALDKRNASRLRTIRQKLWQKLVLLDQWSDRIRQQDKRQLVRFEQVFWEGGSIGTVKKRTGNPVLDRLSSWWYDLCRFLSWLDTTFSFPGRPYRAKTCRVRSKSEKRIANWLTDRGVRFVYEKPLVLGVDDSLTRKLLTISALVLPKRLAARLTKKQKGVLLHPDFYIPKLDCYIEYWGLADSDPDYESLHRAKLALYGKHGITIVSVYPRHLRTKLDKSLPPLIKEASGHSI